MPGGFEQSAFGEHWRVHRHAPVVACDLGCEQLEHMSDHSAGGQPQRQPGADDRMRREDGDVVIDGPVIERLTLGRDAHNRLLGG